jgi:hypothetical protein
VQFFIAAIQTGKKRKIRQITFVSDKAMREQARGHDLMSS